MRSLLNIDFSRQSAFEGNSSTSTWLESMTTLHALKRIPSLKRFIPSSKNRVEKQSYAEVPYSVFWISPVQNFSFRPKPVNGIDENEERPVGF